MFGNRLKIALENCNMTQVQLAQELDLTSPAINRWCNNITQPDNDTIVKIAKILKISTDFLLGNDEQLSKYEKELREKEVLKELLVKNGYMKPNEDLTKEELDKLMKFVVNNKDFLKGNK